MIWNEPVKKETIPVGTTWTIAEDGDWECPATGSYQVELHGGGGGAAYGNVYNTAAGGGGSGEVWTVSYQKGQIISAKIGTGGGSQYAAIAATGNTGGATTFGTLSVAGGGGGDVYDAEFTVGAASGSIATAGSGESQGKWSTENITVAGGYGNQNNTAQTYGNGGSVVKAALQDGQPGAAIITYLGKG